MSDSEDWIELSETGFDAAIAWGVPIGCLGRAARDDSERIVEGFEQATDGSFVSFNRSFTTEDRRRLDSGTNAYLIEAGIPAQPTGYTWYVKKSTRFGDDTADALADFVIKRGGDAPERILDDLAHILPMVYPLGVS